MYRIVFLLKLSTNVSACTAKSMSSNSEQNGCQPPLSQQTAPPSDSRMRNASSSDQQNRICRDYVWGICGKGTQCKFRHEFDVESMKTIVKFCHDYQNRTGCTRPDCTYLHTTREEENLFLTAGTIPRALAERHAAMFSAPLNVYVNEYMGQAPPPLPPPQPAATQAVPPSCTPTAPPPPHLYAATQPPPPPAPLRPLLAPPPPPPPPPPPATTSTVPVQMTPNVFSASAPAPAPFSSPPMYSVTQCPPPLPMFDASRPPPPLSTVTLKQKKSVVVKRPAESSEAGPSKTRKLESSKVVDRLCESCIQRELRIELFRKEMQKLECEMEYKTYIYETKSEGYESGRLLLKSVLSPESFRILDEYIEGSSQQINQMSAFSATSTVPRQLLLQLMECVFSNSRSLLDSPPVPSVGVDELSLLQSLTALTRRSEPINDAPTDVIQAVLGMLRNSTSSTYRKPAPESRTDDNLGSDNSRASTSATMISSSAVNGLSHFLNGQKAESTQAAGATGAAAASLYPAAPAAATRPYPAPSAALPPAAPQPATLAPAVPPALPAPHHPAPHLPAPHLPAASLRPAAVASQPAAPPARPPAAYLPYQPPPARPYYPQPYPANFSHMPNINAPYKNPRAGLTPQVPTRPATAATQPPTMQPAQNYNLYGAGRYPSQPHYYPPFQ